METSKAANFGARVGAKSFKVAKDRAGRLRWVAVSSTAFKDRDGEIVSTKALAQDCARADATGSYGPLRWWHVPGLDVGDCDYNAVAGRSLIESGTFRDERIGAAIASKSAELALSIGFVHPHTDPDSSGVFHQVQRFERSLAPAGKVSNLFTRLVVGDMTMLTQEKAQQLRALVGDDLLRDLLLTVDQTEKTADAAGVAYKAADEAGTEADVAVEVAPVEAETADTDEGYVGDLKPAEFKALLIGAFQEAMGPLHEAISVESKMRGAIDELKTMVGGYTTKKDADQSQLVGQQAAHADQVAQLSKQIADAQRTLKELVGEQPRAFAAGYRASEDPATKLDDDHRLKAAMPTADPITAFFGDVTPWGTTSRG